MAILRILNILLDKKLEIYKNIIENITSIYKIKPFIFFFDNFNPFSFNNIDLIVSNKIISTNIYTILVDTYDINNEKFTSSILKYIDNYKLINKLSNKFLTEPPVFLNKNIYDSNITLNKKEYEILEQIQDEISFLTDIIDVKLDKTNESTIISINTKEKIQREDLFYILKISKNLIIKENLLTIEYNVNKM